MSWLSDLRAVIDHGYYTFRPPAEEDAIEDLNKFCEFPIPSDLFLFLTIHNGFYGDNNGWEYRIISSTEDIKNDTKRLRNLPHQFEKLGDISTLIQIGYEPNRHCFTIYKCKNEKISTSEIRLGVYHFSPLVPEQPQWKGYCEFVADDLESYIRSRYKI
jgi:hypothetical protein